MASDAPRSLRIVLGDQLDRSLTALEDYDAERDLVWMAENDDEISRVPSHRLRIALFLSAMRHHRDRLSDAGFSVRYHALTEEPDDDAGSGFAEILAADLRELAPDTVVLTRPGDYRVLEALRETVASSGAELDLREDDRFLGRPEDFAEWADGRKRWVMGDFYRRMRQRTGILVEDGEPEGGEWSYDAQNRESFSGDGPQEVARRPRWPLGTIENEVVHLVESRYADRPGSVDALELWPRTPEQARESLEHFVDAHLARFGDYQDAMWSGEPFLHHALLSFPLNVGLLRPRECLEAVVEAYESGDAPLNAVEGFVRQILGWREFVRGVYWELMPEYAERNALGADRSLPQFYWDGETDMACVRDAMSGVLAHGYAHHIQRLMILGLFAQLYGVDPGEFNRWHLAMYVDAVDWVSLPNALGMSQFADGGVMGTKPYCASGNYIDRMSNYCGDCPYDPHQAAGEGACPFTTLYWDFLARHEDELRGNHRMGFQYANLDRKSSDDLAAIRERAATLRKD